METKRVAIAELSDDVLDDVIHYQFGHQVADRYKSRHSFDKRHRLLWAHQSGYVDVPVELVEQPSKRQGSVRNHDSYSIGRQG